MTTPMSATQAEFLRDLRDGRDLRRWNGWRTRRTRVACERRGWATVRSPPGHGGRRWELTDDGRRALADHERRLQLTDAIEALAEEYLGRFGVVSVADAYEGEQERIVVTVEGDSAPANAHVPRLFRGFPVDIVQGAGFELHVH